VTGENAQRMLTVGIFDNPAQAQQVVERLIDEGFPMDQLSLLGRAGQGSGDDVLGVSYHGTGEKMKVWGEHGAFWGALWGLLAGATGMFVLPGLGPLLAAGPVVEALAGALAGAVVAGGAMAGAAALSELATALHRIGLPPEAVTRIEKAIDAGKPVVILHTDAAHTEKWDRLLRWGGADPVLHLTAIGGEHAA